MSANIDESDMTCRFDAPSVLAAIDQLAGLIEDLRAGLVAMDQKLTQLRTIEHQNLVQNVKQVRSALDMATRDNKRQIEALTGKVVAATKRVQSLDLALSNHKLEALSQRASQARTVASSTSQGEKASAEEAAR